MSKICLEGFYINGSPERIHCESVTQIVNAMMFQSGFLQQLLKLLPDGGLGQMRPILVSEYQILEALFNLLSTVIDHPSESRWHHLLSAALYCPLPFYVKIGAKWKHFLNIF